jgi:hypothetical protein
VGEDQKWFRSDIRSLLYVVKLFRPDLANPARKLSKVMESTRPAHLKELRRLIHFIASTKVKRLKVKADGY